MISLRAYGLLEDAWTGGVADWCRAASGVVLGGGQAWMVTTSDGQANWIKRRLLCERISLFGVQFLDARALRRELCLRRGLTPPVIGRHALELLLRLFALTHEDAHPELAAVARHPGACLAALDDFAAAGWLDDGPELFAETLPRALHRWLPLLRATGSWVPQVDRQIAEPTGAEVVPLTVCVFGWDAASWPVFDLLAAAVRTATAAEVYTPFPRGTSEAIQQHWLDALEESFDTTFEPCDASDFESSQFALASRLEGTDLASGPGAPVPSAPELLAGHDTGDMAALACDFVARWLAARPDGKAGRDAADGGQRLVLLCPKRDVSSVSVVKALATAGIAVEDEVGEQPEPSLAIQIQRAVIAYHQDEGGIQALLALIELLNEHAAVAGTEPSGLLARLCPLDPVEVRRALYNAFADLQHHSARVLGETVSLGRSAVARPLRELIDHLGTWPDKMAWRDILGRWEHCLGGLALTTALLEPLWSQLAALPIDDQVPPAAFFQFLRGVLAGVPPRRSAEGMNRFARVVVTSLEGAMGQTWGGALFLDSNEGAWPIYPGENSFLDDAARTRLNLRRAAHTEETGRPPDRGYLLTAADRAQLEHFRFLEILENCTGPLAFAGVARDPSEPSKELYANEWALRCLVESGHAPREGEKLLDRWRQAVRRTHHPAAPLAARDAAHLREVFARRRDPEAGFDAYFFNFAALTAPDELPWNDAWSGRDLETAWNRPATFALQQIFGAEPWRDEGGSLNRRENWVVGRLVHRWLRVALNVAQEPRRMTADDWRHALGSGLAWARAGSEKLLRRTLGGAPADPGVPGELPFWWQSTLSRAEWAARRCLESLAETAQAPGPDGAPARARWLCLERTFRADLKTAGGSLKVQARCDAVLLDGPEFAGASGQLIDIRTGAAPTAGAPTAAQLEASQGLGVGALFLMGIAEGLRPETTQAGVIHPDRSNVAQWKLEYAATLAPAVEQLAGQQRSLVFGQKNPASGGHGREQSEILPLATTPVATVVLAAKAARTRESGGGSGPVKTG